jgi:uncharacterized protein DUF4282
VDETRPPAQGSDPGFSFSTFFSFRYLITPAFIRVIYILGAILITLGALFVLVAPVGPGGIIQVILYIIVANLWWRIVLELVMVLFRINDSLAAIERRGRGM